jgi:hypothetical protein
MDCVVQTRQTTGKGWNNTRNVSEWQAGQQLAATSRCCCNLQPGAHLLLLAVLLLHHLLLLLPLLLVPHLPLQVWCRTWHPALRT